MWAPLHTMSVPPDRGEGQQTSPRSNPRRQPAHLSVSLRHESPSNPRAKPSQAVLSPRKRALDGVSEDNETNSTSDAQKWFDTANKNPRVAFSQALQGKTNAIDMPRTRRANTITDDPPYFLPASSSPGSNVNARSGFDQDLLRVAQQTNWRRQGTATNTDTADDFRSVIDDLTIENKKLKERLKRLEKLHSPHLENDRLFEVTIHGLSAKKRRKLEETLRDFTAQLDETSSSDAPKDSSEDISPNHAARSFIPKISTDSTDSIRPVDSAYASMSISGPSSTSQQAPGPKSGKNEAGSHTREENAEHVRHFLENIPAGLMPRRNLSMTENQKKRFVVQRLEQLFTGREGHVVLNGQSEQQQEVSKSAARADDVAANREAHIEGLREAHMLTHKTGDASKPGKLSSNDSRDDTLASRDVSNSSTGSAGGDSEDSELEQRPTRPLDLDPDRAQVPADNVEYLRHLGISTPQLLSDDSSDADSDAQGWIYLNLLINMAQLHIVNVTPDFVRHAVSEVSEKLQLSRDGQKLRWRGGHRGTNLSSHDSSESPNEDDLVPETIKRRKMHEGRFATVPINVQSMQSSKCQADSGIAHYRPMFNHHGTSTESSKTDEGSSNVYSSQSSSKRANMAPWSEKSKLNSRKKRPRDDGTMVFYSHAQFCTDLSGDREIPVPLHSSGLGKDGVKSRKDVLGCQPSSKRILFSRSSSSSSLPFRPLNRQLPTPSASAAIDPPELRVYMSTTDRPSSQGSDASTHLQTFEACGLGGTQPADHFAMRVKTKRPSRERDPRLSKFSAPGPHMTRFLHQVSQSALDSFTEVDTSARSASAPGSPAPVSIEYVGSSFTKLPPSRLPEPMGYHGASSASDDEGSSDGFTTSGSHVPGRTFFHKSYTSLTEPDTHKWTNESKAPLDRIEDESEDEEMDDDCDDDDDDMSIDMLGHLRQQKAIGTGSQVGDLSRTEQSVEPDVAISAAATIAESDVDL